MKNYLAAIDYLYNRLPMFQRIGPAAYKNSLVNTLLLDRLYDSPHKKYATLHIAGTNGKGSVSHMLAAVLQSAGYRTGLYTSPHLKDFRERIRIDGKMIPKSEVVGWLNQFTGQNVNSVIEPSFFELTVAMAFDYFARNRVDIAVIETGLGGRLDSTNIITPEVSIITNISYDHQQLLGNTLPGIAMEKAGIIKPGVPVVISQWQPEVAEVFITKAAEMHSPLFFAGEEYRAVPLAGTSGSGHTFRVYKDENQLYPELVLDLPGHYQRLNLPAVLKTTELLTNKGWLIPEKSIRKGLAQVTRLTGLQGRWQVLGHDPLIICDTAHNEDGIRQVTAQLKETEYRHLHFIFGVVSDKDPGPVLALLPHDASYYFTKAGIPRALDENLLMEKARAFGLTGKSFTTVASAFTAAKSAAGREDLIFITGSNFVVAEIL